MSLTCEPAWALPGARVFLRGHGALPMPAEGFPHVLLGGRDARVCAASPRGVRIVIPPDSDGGSLRVHIDELPGDSTIVHVARPLASDVHQVDSPAFDREGRLYVTHSGGRNSKGPVPLFRISRDGTREPVEVEIANPTSLALGPDGLIYVSSRFDGNVYRITEAGRAELYAAELGVPTGLAFDREGALYVGDRSGTIFKVSPRREVEQFASLPQSIAAFHLAFGPDDALWVTAPTFSTRDALYRITPDRTVTTVTDAFGRPQGLAFGPRGDLYVVDALAGNAGLYRVDLRGQNSAPVLVLAATALIGVAVDPDGGLVLASSDRIWKLDVEV